MKKRVSLILVLIVFLAVTKSSYAAVEVVPSKNGKGTDMITHTTISNSYLLCKGMNKSGETLEGTTVVPHLATNKDWGAVSYLANSMYGTNTRGENTGVEIEINGVKYFSTTGNETGVMNWGSNPNKGGMWTQTSGLLNAYDASVSTAKDNVVELENNKNTRFVDIIADNISNKGMAMRETQGFYSSPSVIGRDINYPVSARSGWFGFVVGYNYNGSGGTSGVGSPNLTFRPVIWNE